MTQSTMTSTTTQHKHGGEARRRFTCECDLCMELLTDYLSAANGVVETKDRPRNHGQQTAGDLAAGILDHAVQHRNEARKRLLIHKEREH